MMSATASGFPTAPSGSFTSCAQKNLPSRRAISASRSPSPGRPSTLKKLEREGLLALSGDGGRHGKPVSLTPQGLELAEKTVDRVIESEQKALLDLSPDEQKQLLDAMRRYNAMLNTRMHDILFAQEDIHE